eukprot:TRINITY_DN9716_c0_g1_i2.p1 TRINITY_DN9716_c0_g1~~TRINITY_DN9716_c0_g1_i2.p1  ORF type:complete len:274 (+),score=47.26 TRINITY_DN9716_c0_g1_i2:80-823(+)
MSKPILAFAALVSALGAAALFGRERILEVLLDVLSQIEAMGPLGMLLYVACFVLATQLLIPASPLEMAAGLLFGEKYGLLVATLLGSLGKQASASVSFLLGRTLLRNYVKETLLPRFPIIEKASRALETDHIALICMVRLAPIPTSAKSLGLAVTGVPYTIFVFISAIFGMPWSLISAFVGSTLVSIPELMDQQVAKQKMWELIGPLLQRPATVCAGVAVGAVALYMLGCRARGLLKKYQEVLEKAS